MAKVGAKIITYKNGEFIIEGENIQVYVDEWQLVVQTQKIDRLKLPIKEVQSAVINRISTTPETSTHA